MKLRSRALVVVIVVLIVIAVVIGLKLRLGLRCAGFAGPDVTASDLPPAPPPEGELRIGAWNIRNFPVDDRPQRRNMGFVRRTNICDLKQVLAGLEADVLGVEEIHDPRRFERVLRSAAPDREYRVVFSAGGGRWGQHLGIAWDQRRLHLAGEPQEVTEVALDESLRPALAAYLKSARPDGIDLTVVQVHLRATPKGYQDRIKQYHRLAEWVEGWVARTGDRDVVVQGDFNTTGARGGTVAGELAEADRILAAAGLRRLVNAAGCSEYWEGPGPRDGRQVPSLLDQVYVSGLEELDAGVPLRPWLHCARFGCRQFVSWPGHEDGTFWDVSDHCPITFQVWDRDED